jgi:hypothetical protein
MSRTRWLLAVVLVLVIAGGARAAEDPDRARLVALFNRLQDVLLTINSEIMRYTDQLDDVSRRLRAPSIWAAPELDRSRLTPTLKELNRLKSALALIGTGLEQKYAQVRSFQTELRDKYPQLQGDIDTYYAMFDRLYESSRERHKKTTAQMTELKRWCKEQVAAKQGEADDDEVDAAPQQVVSRPRAKRSR